MRDTELEQKAELRAFQTLVELIRRQEIVPGERLFEPDLAERLNMSRTPLRNALSRLVAEGVLVKEPGRKGYLLPALSRDDMQQIFLVRASIEGAAAGVLAKFCTPEQNSDLRSVNWKESELFSEHRDKDLYADLNEVFHRKIVSFSGNVYLLRFFDCSYWRSTLYTLLYATFYLDGDRPQERVKSIPSWKEHAMIVDALENHDAERSRYLMEEHVINTWRYRSKLGKSQKKGN